MKEVQIKKQYHETVRIQQRQYKALQKQMVATVPKDRHRAVVRQTKEEQMRKIAMLAMQYERTISDMAQQQTVSRSVICLVASLVSAWARLLILVLCPSVEVSYVLRVVCYCTHTARECDFSS